MIRIEQLTVNIDTGGNHYRAEIAFTQRTGMVHPYLKTSNTPSYTDNVRLRQKMDARVLSSCRHSALHQLCGLFSNTI